MRHQVIADEEDAGASPPTASTKSRSPGGVCGGGRKVTPTMEDIDETADGVVVEVEKLFPNGDSYSGEFAGNAPQGHGKCIWIDGCVYDGEWRRGNAAGTGKFSWPSGATYDGEFMDGRMEGYGSFIGANGETYQGSWLADQKHGYGKKSYVNGDFYEGQWKRDLQEGQGRYVWRDGIQYVGEWRNGMISGRGVLILANGDLYDGHWENGVPKRSGVFAWPDCSCYLGSWSRDAKSQPQMNGVSYSASLSSSKQSSVDGVFARSSEAEDIPGIFKREPDSEARKITCESTDTIAASVVCVDGSEFGEGEAAYGQSNCCLATDGVKPWPTISKGHKSYDLVHNLQLGIRYSVGKPSSKQQMKLWPGDFDPREKFWTKFPPEGSNITRPHHSSEFRWKDYCPKVFRHLRKLFAVDPADYVKSICGTDSLRELSSPGKSGSLFFLTQDDRFIIKTVRKCEVKEQFYIMKADEVVSRSFHIYPTTDQAGKYECAAILKASDFTEVDRAGCQFTTTATVLDNGSQIMSEYESKGGGLNGFFQSIKSGWKRMWDGLINFFTGKTCSCHLQYVCVSWILMFGLLLAIFPTVIILLWLLHQKGFFDPLHDWWDDRFGNKTETTKIYSKYGKHSRKPHIHHHKDHYVHHKEKLYRKKQNYNGHRHLKPDGGVHHVHKETHKHKHKHKLNKHEPELRDSSAVRGLQSVAKHHEEMQAGRKRGHTYRKELYSKPYIQSHRH